MKIWIETYFNSKLHGPMIQTNVKLFDCAYVLFLQTVYAHQNDSYSAVYENGTFDSSEFPDKVLVESELSQTNNENSETVGKYLRYFSNLILGRSVQILKSIWT